MRRFTVVALLCIPAAALSQATEHTISPGMSRAQVVAELGAPSTQRTASEFTYMFYPNACGRACGMNDLVILRRDSVYDAIFRSPNRRYTGTSSSPEEVRPAAAHSSSPAHKPMTIHKEDTPAKPAAPTQMKPPAKANDATPSIPTKQPSIKPAAKPPAPDKTTPG
jgi:hypothetical protein